MPIRPKLGTVLPTAQPLPGAAQASSYIAGSTSVTTHNADPDAHPALDARLDVLETGAYNVMDYGATGDGITDDTAAILATITACNAAGGGVVYFPPGTYRTTTGIVSTDGTNVTLLGAGIGATTLKLANSTSANTHVLWLSDAPQHVAIRNLTIDGNRANQSDNNHHGLIVEWDGAASAEDIIIENVEIRDTAGRGMMLYACRDILIRGCRLRDIGRGSTAADRTTDGAKGAIVVYGNQERIAARIVENDIEGCRDMGISIHTTGTTTANSDILIANNIVRGAHWIGIALGTKTNNATVTGNVVYGVTGNGIDTGSGSNVSVTGNVIERCEAGIIPDGTTIGAYNHVYSGNSLLNLISTDAEGDADYASFGTGIGALGGDPTTARHAFVITDNTIDGCAGSGVLVQKVTSALVANNIIRNCGLATATFDDQAGIVVFAHPTDYDTTNVVITDNYIADDQASKTMDYCLRFSGPADGITGCVVTGNTFASYLTSAVSVTGGVLLGALGVVHGNEGYSNTLECRVTRADGAGSEQSVANTTWTTILFDTETFDPAAMHSTSANTSRVTVPQRGRYRITAHGSLAGTNFNIVGRILKNGGATPVLGPVSMWGGNSGGDGPVVSGLVDLAAGDYVELQVYQAAGAARNTYQPSLQVERVGWA